MEKMRWHCVNCWEKKHVLLIKSKKKALHCALLDHAIFKLHMEKDRIEMEHYKYWFFPNSFGYFIEKEDTRER